METTSTGKTKNSVEKYAKKVSKPLNQKLFSENFIHDPLNIFSKPMGDIIIRIM